MANILTAAPEPRDRREVFENGVFTLTSDEISQLFWGSEASADTHPICATNARLFAATFFDLNMAREQIGETRFHIYSKALTIVADYLAVMESIPSDEFTQEVVNERASGFLQEAMRIDLSMYAPYGIRNLRSYQIHGNDSKAIRISRQFSPEDELNPLELEVAARSIAAMMITFGPGREFVDENGYRIEPLRYFGLGDFADDHIHSYACSLDYSLKEGHLAIGGVERISECGTDSAGIAHFQLSRVASPVSARGKGHYKTLSEARRRRYDLRTTSIWFTARSAGVEAFWEYLHSENPWPERNSPDRTMLYHLFDGARVYGATSTGTFPNNLMIIGAPHADSYNIYGDVQFFPQDELDAIDQSLAAKAEVIRSQRIATLS